MKVLHLTLKKKWFDMIASGEKKEEYREIKSYWMSRLLCEMSWDINENPIKINADTNFLNKNSYKAVPFDVVRFRNGYGKDAPTIDVEFKGLEINMGYPRWGAIFRRTYFVIKLGNILNNR